MCGDPSLLWADDGGGLDAVGVSACGPSSAAVWPIGDDSTGGRGDCAAGLAVSGGRPAGEPVYAGAGAGEGGGSACVAVEEAVWRRAGADDLCAGDLCGEAEAGAG